MLSISTLFLAASLVSCNSEKELKQASAESNQSVAEGNYKAPKASESINIDGKAEEKSWSKAEWKPIKYKWLGDDFSENDFQGKYKILWDKEHIYFLAEIHDDSLSDQEKDAFINWWEDDCLELFIDEDRSKDEHQYNHNAFAYHITLDYDVVDMGPDQKPHLYNDHLTVKRTNTGKSHTWEVAMKVFDKSFDDNKKDNRPVSLETGKIMGFAVSYNDNDGDNRRENFIGSINVEGEDKNRGWIDSGIFGELELVK